MTRKAKKGRKEQSNSKKHQVSGDELKGVQAAVEKHDHNYNEMITFSVISKS